MSWWRRKSALTPEKAAPSAEEVAARPDLVKLMVESFSERVYELDVEHAIILGITTTGAPVVFHTYGKDMSMTEVARMLQDASTAARKAARRND